MKTVPGLLNGKPIVLKTAEEEQAEFDQLYGEYRKTCDNNGLNCGRYCKYFEFCAENKTLKPLGEME